MGIINTICKDIDTYGVYNYIVQHYKNYDGIHVQFDIIDLVKNNDISELNFTTRPYNALKRDMVNTLGDLSDRINTGRINKIRNLGTKSLQEIYSKFMQYCWNNYTTYQKERFVLYLLKNNEEIV